MTMERKRQGRKTWKYMKKSGRRNTEKRRGKRVRYERNKEWKQKGEEWEKEEIRVKRRKRKWREKKGNYEK